MGYNTGKLIRAEKIQEITQRYYEEGRQDRCYHWVWKHHICPVFGIGYRSYLNYLKIDTNHDKLRESEKTFAQLPLFEK